MPSYMQNSTRLHNYKVNNVKRKKNAKQGLGYTLKDTKYSLKWYKTPIIGFKDNVRDLRMKKYI